MRPFPRLLVGLALALVTAPATAHEYKLGDLEIGHPYVIESTGKTAAGYFSVTNTGSGPDSLVSITTADVPRSEVHETATDSSGVSRMMPVPVLEIPPGETVALQPGDLHVMFMGLAHPLVAGDHLSATLVFQKAGEIAVDFQVQPRTGTSGGDMSTMPGMSH